MTKILVKIVNLQLGYMGLLDLASFGHVSKIFAMPVYKDDYFEYQYGTNENLITYQHK